MKRKKYRSIFISDTHLGFRHSRSDLLTNFLKHHDCENLYLVGDIIDLWEIENKFKWRQSDSLALRQILNKKKKGTKIFYITGNHDGAFRPFIKHLDIENTVISNETVHIGVDGKKYLVVHGDIFDANTPTWFLLSKVGARAYDYSIILGTFINKFRKKPWSLSNYLKQKVKAASKYINRYERHMIEYCKEGGYNGVICGHIHKAEIRTISTDHDPIVYLNCGDWVESCTALVEDYEGNFHIIHWLEKASSLKLNNDAGQTMITNIEW